MLSLGGGTQSTVLALLADQEIFDSRPDFAVFADTGWEPEAVYDNINWLKSQLSYPVVTVNIERSLREDVLEGVNARGKPWLSIPVFLARPDGTPAGMNWRQCTTDYKINPIRAEVRKRLGLATRSPVPASTSIDMWLGITTDETERMRTSPDRWITNCYPLIDLGMSRNDCIDWFHQEYPDRYLPRSACIGCPYRSPVGWVQMSKTDKTSFEEAVKMDAVLRSNDHNATSMFRNKVFLHSRRIPLYEAVELDAQKFDADENGHWGNECAGICGV